MKEITISTKHNSLLGLAAALVTLVGVPASIYIFGAAIKEHGERITRHRNEIVIKQYSNGQAIIELQKYDVQLGRDFAQCRVDFSVMSTAVDKYAARIDGVNSNIMRYLERTNAK